MHTIAKLNTAQAKVARPSHVQWQRTMSGTGAAEMADSTRARMSPIAEPSSGAEEEWPPTALIATCRPGMRHRGPCLSSSSSAECYIGWLLLWRGGRDTQGQRKGCGAGQASAALRWPSAAAAPEPALSRPPRMHTPLTVVNCWPFSATDIIAVTFPERMFLQWGGRDERQG